MISIMILNALTTTLSLLTFGWLFVRGYDRNILVDMYVRISTVD